MVGGELAGLATVFLGRVGLFLPVGVGVDPGLWAVGLGVESAPEVEQAGRNVDVADEGLVPHAAFFLIGVADHERNPQSTLVDRGLSACEGHPVVGGKDNHCLFVEAGFLEDLHEAGHPLVDAGNALVVVGQLLPRFRGIGKEGGDGNLFRVVEDFLNPGMSLSVGLVPEQVGLELTLRGLVPASSAVRVGGGEVEKERPIALLGDEGPGLFRHLNGVAGASLEVGLVVKDLLGSGVVLPDVSRAVARVRHGPRKGETDGVVVAGELVEVVLVAVLTVGMVVEAAHHHRSTGRATGCCGIGVEEEGSVLGEGVDGRSLGYRVAVATQGRALVVGDEKDDVFLSSGKGGCPETEGRKDGSDSGNHGEQVVRPFNPRQGFGDVHRLFGAGSRPFFRLDLGSV